MPKQTPTITPTPVKPYTPSAEALNAVKLGYVKDTQAYDNSVLAGKNLAANTITPPANNINAKDLNATPYSVPAPTPKTGYAGLIESSNAAITGLTPVVANGEKDIKSVYDKLGQQASNKADLYNSEGIYTKQKAYNELVNTINAKELAYRRKVEKIQNDNPTGQLQAGQSIAVDKVEKDWASEKADLSIAAAFARDDYTTAKQIVDDKITAQTEDLTTQLDGLKFFYTQNANKLSDAQKTLLQQQTNQVETELADKKQRLSEIGNIQLEAAQNGAPASVITAIGRSEDTTSAITSAGRYINPQTMGGGSGGGSGSGGGINFTNTQVAKGAQNAGMTISQFQGLDEETKNFFVNGDLSGSKATIDDAFLTKGASLDDVKATIQSMPGLSPQAQQYLIQYAEQSGNAPLSPEQEKAQNINDLTDLKAQGYKRGEAYDEILKTYTTTDKGEPITIPKGALNKIKSDIEDALVSVYGQTFLQRWIPGGR